VRNKMKSGVETLFQILDDGISDMKANVSVWR
jgi:hypothetical protein